MIRDQFESDFNFRTSDYNSPFIHFPYFMLCYFSIIIDK